MVKSGRSISIEDGHACSESLKVDEATATLKLVPSTGVRSS